MLTEIGQKAKETSYVLGKMGTNLKNAGLLAAAQEILDEENEILKANAADVARAKERGMAPGLVDRLELNHKRIEGIVEGMDGNLNPAGNASRAQIATILMRFCEDVAQ